MDLPALRGKRLLAAVAFVAATLVLAVQLINPTPVVVSVGENGAQTDELGEYFTYSDVGTIVVAAILAGASGAYLLVGPTEARSGEPAAVRSGETAPARNGDRSGASGRAATDPPAPAGTPPGAVGDGGSPAESATDPAPDREAWEDALERLHGNEEAVFSVLVEADGKLPQREIVEETDLSKATVSRTLDTLESKRLLERKRRGMGNVVVLN